MPEARERDRDRRPRRREPRPRGHGRPSAETMTRAATETARAQRSSAILRNLDLAIVVIGLVPAIALGAPVLGIAVGAGAWLAQSLLAHLDRSWIKRSRPPRTQLGLNLAEAFGRIWLLAGAIVAAGVIGGRADGLTAAVTIFVAYSIAFAIRVLNGPAQRRSALAATGAGAGARRALR